MLLSLEGISKHYGIAPVLQDVSCYLNPGDKVGLLGINGTGKSTLLRIAAGEEEPDSGTVLRDPGVRISFLAQTPKFGSGSVLEQAMQAAAGAEEYQVKAMLSRLGFTNMTAPVERLSGGQKRRVAIAAALASPCDLLILDEPTNHLDHSMIRWMEEYLRQFTGALLMVTHDRYFLERVVNRIGELSQGVYREYPANYSEYLALKAQREEMEQNTLRKRKSLYQTELEWMNQGVKARGTKSRSRIQRFEELEESLQTARQGELSISSAASRLGKKILELENVSKAFEGNLVLSHFSYMLPRNARVGVIGNNGCGKTTLLQLLAGRIQPDSGTIQRGETVRIGYFSQECEEMDPQQSLLDYVRSYGERVDTGEGTVTASQLLERFLFTGAKQQAAIKSLSGGEKRRLYLLRVLMEAPNVLLLDEPTNDLDVETLSLLEEYLESFPGAVVAVSHDRYFLDKIANRILEFGEHGEVREYLGGYSDYFDQVSALAAAKRSGERTAAEKTKKVKEQKLKFSFKEQREFETIDEEIAQLEAGIQELERQIEKESANFERLTQLLEEKSKQEELLSQKMERWVYLNERYEAIQSQNGL